MIHVLIHVALMIARAMGDGSKSSSPQLPPRRRAPTAPAPERRRPTAALGHRPAGATPARPPAPSSPGPRPTPAARAEALVNAGHVGGLLAQVETGLFRPLGRGTPRAPEVLVATTALEAVTRREPRLARFAPDVARIARLATSVGELHEEHALMPSKQRRQEIAALEKRCAREVEHLLADMRDAVRAD